jgi:hypothetical protein
MLLMERNVMERAEPDVLDHIRTLLCDVDPALAVPARTKGGELRFLDFFVWELECSEAEYVDVDATTGAESWLSQLLASGKEDINRLFHCPYKFATRTWLHQLVWNPHSHGPAHEAVLFLVRHGARTDRVSNDAENDGMNLVHLLVMRAAHVWTAFAKDCAALVKALPVEHLRTCLAQTVKLGNRHVTPLEFARARGGGPDERVEIMIRSLLKMQKTLASSPTSPPTNEQHPR